jgi:hypothetical protein
MIKVHFKIQIFTFLRGILASKPNLLKATVVEVFEEFGQLLLGRFRIGFLGHLAGAFPQLIKVKARSLNGKPLGAEECAGNEETFQHVLPPTIGPVHDQL